MSSLNSQQQTAPPPGAQYYITTGMPPPLIPATGTSILKSNITTQQSSSGAQQTTNVLTSSMNSVISGNTGGGVKVTNTNGNISLDNTKFVTTSTNYMPVLLTNQTLISSVDTVTQNQTQLPPKLTPTSMLVSGTSAASNNANISHITGNNTSNKPVVLTSAHNSGNITYQVLTASTQNNNLSSPVIATPNGTVSVLLASSPTMATAGHVAAPIIIRNTPTTATTKAIQIKQQQQQLQHQQQQQKPKLHTFNAQTLSADILKQIVVGNPNAGTTNSTNLAPGTTLLKPTILQNKTIIAATQQQQQQQIANKTLIKNAKMVITPNQQQKLNNHTVITKTTSPDNSSQMFAALGMELVKAPPPPSTVVAQTVQKLPQVSLLQNSNKKSNNLNEISMKDPSAISVLKNPHEIKVGNLNSEVSLIKKPKEIASTSLLKTSNKMPIEIGDKNKSQDLEKSTNNNKEQQVVKNNPNESYSLLKSNNNNNDLKKFFEEEVDNNAIKIPNTPPIEKQKSLLRPLNALNKSPTNITGNQQVLEKQLTSPRSQRSNSCNTNLKAQISMAASNNERRHSEPAKIELAEKLKVLEKSTQQNKSSDKMDNSENSTCKQDLEQLKSQEIDIYFEDEEYLESSGDKLSIASDKSQDSDSNSLQKPEKLNGNTEDETKTQEIKELKLKEVEEEKEEHIKSYNTEENKQENSKQIENSTELDKEQKPTASSTPDKKDNNENKNSSEEDDDDDDDVTILPMEEMEIEQIEIEDDEEDVTPTNENKQLNESLLCDEQILISSSSSLSNNSSDQNSTSLIKSPKFDTPANTAATASPLLKKSLTEPKVLSPKDESQLNGYSSVLDMLSNFNMLNWRERIGTARGTNLKFQLNEFNLIQLYEKSLPNKRIHTAYEKPIYERESSHRKSENGDPPTFYSCRRCSIQGPSVDFLAPEFCSLFCLKRDYRKRRDDNVSLMRKRNRLQNNNAPNKNYSNTVTTMQHNEINNPPPLSYIKKPKFRWSNYMNSNFSTMAAPISLFLNPFPTGPNNFMVGMKLEAIDPENCALFCVCTIIDIMGYRLKLNFDGYDSAYDFWVNADSMDIFPPGWCAKTNRILQPPKGIAANKFNWGAYLTREKSMPAPRQLFTHLNSSSLAPRNPFKIGMHLEAEDLNDTGKLCVASVADVLDDRIRIHFDGWDDCYDIIVDISSPYIHPCGWHEGRQQLVVPPDCENTAFNWNDYIRKQGTGEAASEELFAPRDPIGFKANMRLEVVDPRNPSLIRPATVITHKGHRVKLHLDGWPNDYCFWLEDDSPDLHPIGWCDATDHDLEPPPGFQMAKQRMPCPIEGCRGIGNAKKPFVGVHATREGCPYAPENWRLVVEKPQRVNYENIVRTLPKPNKQLMALQMTSLQSRLSEQQILERIQMLDNIKTRNVVVQQDKLPSNHADLLNSFTLSNLKKEETKYSKISTTTSSSTSPSSTNAFNTENNALDVNLDIAKEFLYDYGPRLQQTYTLWQKNFTFDTEKIKRNPLEWSTTEVSVFVDLYLKCRKTAAIFSTEDIDGEAFLMLQQLDLTEKLGLKLGPAVKLYTCILQLRTLAVTKFDTPYKRIVGGAKK